MISLKARCAKYVGVPFRERGQDPNGWDCWGLYHYIGRIELGRDFPPLSEAYDRLKVYSTDNIADVIGVFLGDWHRIYSPIDGCAVAFDKRGDVAQRGGEPRIHHIGLMLGAREMIHVQKGAIGGTVIVPFDDLFHRRFFAGFWERN